jgi:hypothetical protein
MTKFDPTRIHDMKVPRVKAVVAKDFAPIWNLLQYIRVAFASQNMGPFAYYLFPGGFCQWLSLADVLLMLTESLGSLFGVGAERDTDWIRRSLLSRYSSYARDLLSRYSSYAREHGLVAKPIV